MNSERDLTRLLCGMNPILDAQPYCILSLPAGEHSELTANAWAVVHEDEGDTLIIASEQACLAGLPTDDPWARVTLTIYSDLHAVGLLVRVSQALASAGIALNVVSAYHHDHLFIPWQQRQQALDCLEALSREASAPD